MQIEINKFQALQETETSKYNRISADRRNLKNMTGNQGLGTHIGRLIKKK